MSNVLNNALVQLLGDGQLLIPEKIELLTNHIMECTFAVRILSGKGVMSPEYLIACMKEILLTDNAGNGHVQS